MKHIVSAALLLSCLAFTACTNLYEENYSPSGNAGIAPITEKPQVVFRQLGEHKMAAQEMAKGNVLLGESRFQSSNTVRRDDLETFSQKIGADLAISSKEYIRSLTTQSTEYRHVYLGTPNPVHVPYHVYRTEDVYEYWATFFKKGAAPVVP